jgi:hypothetical protein
VSRNLLSGMLEHEGKASSNKILISSTVQDLPM